MYDINNFRITENALFGFCIEQKRFYMTDVSNINSKRSFFGYGSVKPEIVNLEHSEQFHHMKMPKDENNHIGFFKSKNETIDFLKKICTPEKRYYPSDLFKEAKDV